MSARSLARICNHFEPSPDALPIEALLSGRETAELLGLRSVQAVRKRAERLGIPGVAVSRRYPGRMTRASGPAHVRYWTPQQVERLRGDS